MASKISIFWVCGCFACYIFTCWHVSLLKEARSGHRIPWNWRYRQPTVPGREPKSSARAASAPNHWALSSPQGMCFKDLKNIRTKQFWLISLPFFSSSLLWNGGRGILKLRGLVLYTTRNLESFLPRNQVWTFSSACSEDIWGTSSRLLGRISCSPEVIRRLPEE